VFFYDEEIPDQDPLVLAVPPDELPTCPEDSDDCQGMNEQVTSGSPQPDGPLQFILSLGPPDCEWQAEGVVFTNENDGERTLVRYNQFIVSMVQAINGPHNILRTTTGGLFNSDVCDVMSGSYDENKALWDKAIKSLRMLGMKAKPPGAFERDITSIK
jgi:hypothetical protein